MTDNENFCEYCGSPLADGANFCEACGQRVKKPAAAQPAQDGAQTLISRPPVMESPAPRPTPISTPPQAVKPAPRPTPMPTPVDSPRPAVNPPAAKPKGKVSLPVILGGAGCLVVLCLLLAAGGIVLLMRGSSASGDLSKVVPVEATTVALPTDAPAAVQAPLATRAPLPTEYSAPTQVPEPTQSDEPTEALVPNQEDAPALSWPADIGQQLTGTYFTDDFSTAQYEWADGDDEIRFWGIEDEHFSLHLKVPEYTVWAYLPVDFTPTTISFDAAVQPGYDQGAYGVICHYQDESNYYFASIDPSYQEYSIGYVLNDEYYSLLEEMWMPAMHLNESAHAINRIMVACDPDMITLFINNELEAQATFEFATAGNTAIYGETWEEISTGGYKVLFDNLEAFKPVQ